MNEKKNRSRPGSYFGPILLIVLGVIFLIHNLGVLPGSGWETFLKLWPALLIIAGLDDLLRGEGVVWPALLIAAGTFLLLNNFGPRSWISWSQLLQLWPVLLIALGFDLVLRSGTDRRTGWSTAAGVILTLLLVAGAVWWIGAEGRWGRLDLESFEATSLEDLDSGAAEVDLNAGQLVVSGLEAGDAFAAGTITSEAADRTFQVRAGRAFFKLESRDFMHFPGTSEWEVGFNRTVPLELAVDQGAGQLFLALDNLELTELTVQQGAGDVVVRLPVRDDLEVRIDQAVGRIRIVIPAGLGIRLEVERALSSLDLPEGFTRSGSAYLSPGYRQAENQVVVHLEQAVGRIEIRSGR